MLKPKEKTNIVTGLFGRYAVVCIKNVQKSKREDDFTPNDFPITLVSTYSGDRYIKFGNRNGTKWYSAITNENGDDIVYPPSPSNKNDNEDILLILPVINHKIIDHKDRDTYIKAIENSLEKNREIPYDVSGLAIDTIGRLYVYALDNRKVYIVCPVNDYEIRVLGEYIWSK